MRGWAGAALVGLPLAPEHRRGHGVLYDAVNSGRIDIARPRRPVAGLPLPRAADGRLVLAADVNHQDLVTTAHPPGGEARFVAKARTVTSVCPAILEDPSPQ